jgi:hypothetical protein
MHNAAVTLTARSNRSNPGNLILWSDTWFVSGKTLQRLVLSHAVPAGNREETDVLKFISERTV